ncbi:MAG: endonuclease/exonuclease/phosphatase family protein [Acidimicrobiales bacterium]
MRVVTFNIHHGTVDRRGPVDPRRLGEACASLEADVLFLQEVDVGTVRVRGADLAAAVAERTGMAHVFGASRWLPGGRYGNAVLVRGDVVEHRVVPLPLAPWWRLWQEPRTALEVRARVRGVDVRLACTHLAVPERTNGPQLAALLDHVEGRAGPLVLGGDLNRRAEDVRPLVEAHGLALVDHGPTFPASAPRVAIDHIAVSTDVRVVAAEVRQTEMSDHAALVVDLEIRA